MYVQNVSEESLVSRVQGVKRKVSPGEIVEVTKAEGQFLTKQYSRFYKAVDDASIPSAGKTPNASENAEKAVRTDGKKKASK